MQPHTQQSQVQFGGVDVAVDRVNVARAGEPADSNALTTRTVDKMRGAIQRATAHPIVISAVQAALVDVSDWGNHNAVIRAVWDWVRDNVRFVQDDDVLRAELGMADELELLIEPPVLLSMRAPAGDCDDFTMLTGSMLLSAGLPAVEVVTICADGADPQRWSHVYLQVFADHNVIVVDCSHGEYPGWEAPRYYARRAWGQITARPAAHDRHIELGARMHGLGEFDWGNFAQSLVEPSFKLATQITQRPGQYVQGGVVASNVPGAMPSPWGGGSAISTPIGSAQLGAGIDTGTLVLLGGGALLLVLLMSRK